MADADAVAEGVMIYSRSLLVRDDSTRSDVFELYLSFCKIWWDTKTLLVATSYYLAREVPHTSAFQPFTNYLNWNRTVFTVLQPYWDVPDFLQNVPFCCPIKVSSDCDLDLVSALYHDKSSARVENLRSCRIIWDHLCLIVCLQLRRQHRQTKRHWVAQVETFPSCRPVFYVWNKEICSEDGIEFLFLQK